MNLDNLLPQISRPFSVRRGSSCAENGRVEGSLSIIGADGKLVACTGQATGRTRDEKDAHALYLAHAGNILPILIKFLEWHQQDNECYCISREEGGSGQPCGWCEGKSALAAANLVNQTNSTAPGSKT